MRMNAETMQRNGIVHATAKDLLSYQRSATVEQIAAVSGYPPNEVRQAIKSLTSQGLLASTLDTVTEFRGFKPC